MTVNTVTTSVKTLNGAASHLKMNLAANKDMSKFAHGLFMKLSMKRLLALMVSSSEIHAVMRLMAV